MNGTAAALVLLLAAVWYVLLAASAPEDPYGRCLRAARRAHARGATCAWVLPWLNTLPNRGQVQVATAWLEEVRHGG